MDASGLLELLEGMARLPTAPYHEGKVIEFAAAWCAERGIDAQSDGHGNVILRTPAAEDGERPALAFAAHMDHPGFEITDTSGPLVEAHWMGGVEPEWFPGAKVVVFGDPDVEGLCVRTELHPKRRRVETMFLDLEGEVRVGDFGSWNVMTWSLEGPMVHTRAADDLVGCSAVLAALGTLVENGEDVAAIGLLTRAEEVGFHGALAAMETGTLPAGTPVVALECSKALPAARQGAGPVVRVGDKKGVYDPGLCLFLRDVAESIADRYTDFTYQRALMDGGVCEATMFGLYGHPSTGLAFPLGNYHNRADDGRYIAEENIHIGDFFGGVTLMVEAARLWPTHGATALDALKSKLLATSKQGRTRLISGSDLPT